MSRRWPGFHGNSSRLLAECCAETISREEGGRGPPPATSVAMLCKSACQPAVKFPPGLADARVVCTALPLAKPANRPPWHAGPGCCGRCANPEGMGIERCQVEPECSESALQLVCQCLSCQWTARRETEEGYRVPSSVADASILHQSYHWAQGTMGPD